MRLDDFERMLRLHVPASLLEETVGCVLRQVGVTTLDECTPGQLDAMAEGIIGVFPVTPALPMQRHLIHGLACEMRWSKTLLSNFLRTHFDVESIDEIRTSKQASAVINRLIGYKRAKERRKTG